MTAVEEELFEAALTDMTFKQELEKDEEIHYADIKVPWDGSETHKLARAGHHRVN